MAALMCARQQMTEPHSLGLCTECKCLFKIKFYLSLVSIAAHSGPRLPDIEEA